MLRLESTKALVVGMAVVLHLLFSAAVRGDPQDTAAMMERIRNDPLGPTCAERYTFIENSLTYVETGADRAEVVSTLATLATVAQCRADGPSALGALIHIAGDDKSMMIQEQLLRIIVDGRTSVLVRWAAADYLALEADEPIRTALLDFVKSHWGTQQATDAAVVLWHCGDSRYLELLDEKLKGRKEWRLETDPDERALTFRLDFQARHMRLAAGPLEEMLRAIASDEVTYDRQWLVQQAARRGRDMKRIHKAVLEYLSLPEERTSTHSKDPLIWDCDRLGLFTPAERKKYVRPRWHAVREYDLVPWATYHKTKWLQVHRAKAHTDDGK